MEHAPHIWSISPVIATRISFTPFALYYGCGVMLDYCGIGGGVIFDNAISVQLI